MWKTDYSEDLIKTIKKLPKIDEFSSVLDLTSGENQSIIELSKNFISIFCLKENPSNEFIDNLKYNMKNLFKKGV